MLGWGTARVTIEELIARKKYDNAIEILRHQLKKSPKNVRLRLQMGDVLAMALRTDAAVTVLLELVEDFVIDGFIPKAIAVLKKVQRIDPGRAGVDERLTELISTHDTQPLARGSGVPGGIGAPAGVIQQPREPSGREKAEPPPPAASGVPFRSPLFSDFSRDELLAVIRGLTLLTYEPGEIILTEGEPGASLLILTSGAVKVYVLNTAGHNVQVRTMEEGEFFGEISLLTGRRRSATVTAATPCELLELDKAALDEIARIHPRVMDVVREFHARRAGSADETMARSI